MKIEEVLKELDGLFTEQNQECIEQFLAEHRNRALQEQDYASLLILYNETIGFYRENGEYVKSMEMCEKALALAEQMQLQETTVYATTLLNVANAKRAAGRLAESMDCYMQVFPIYEKQLAPEDMYYANLYNNLSLLYQEMQEFGKAKSALLKALEIAEKNKNTEFEIAVTHANLANTCIQLEEPEEAKKHAVCAVKMFEEQKVDDAHYSAALSALASLYYREGELKAALELMEKSRDCVTRYLGSNNIQYERLTENIQLIRGQLQKKEAGKDGEKAVSGLELAKRYYEAYGRPMLEEKFPEYVSRIAVGLVGEGSECFGFDDATSRDHDFGPRFVMWVTKETYEETGAALQQAYEQLPDTFLGVQRLESARGRERSGVKIIEEFYSELTGIKNLLHADAAEWLAAEEYGLAAAVNGEVFTDPEGIFTAYRKQLLAGYPEAVKYRRLAQECALFAQNGQYNLPRMRERGQLVAAELAKMEGVRHAMKLLYLLEGSYAPHEKWMFYGLQKKERTQGLFDEVCVRVGLKPHSVTELLERISMLPADTKHATELTEAVETLAVVLAAALEQCGYVGRAEAYLDANTEELLIKSDALLAAGEDVITGLARNIARTEFEAFDKVQNEGGRASCQNNWKTFRIMRMSQYMTWTQEMQLQYLADFKKSYAAGRNMVEEKYARMMASTAPEQYKTFADRLPVISEQSRALMEEIIRIQVQWMEAFAAEYPGLAENARRIHTSEDTPYDTSYETYLRGELGTYSEKMLALYAGYIVAHAQAGKNVAYEIMQNTIEFYGYSSFGEALEKQNR